MPLLPELRGGLEKVDVEAGHLIIRHPETQELRIVQVSKADARAIKELTLEQGLQALTNVPISDWLPGVADIIKDQVITGRLPEELEGD